MKKLLSLILAGIIMVGLMPAASAFGDIANPLESIAAESLASAGIVDSVQSFNPNGTFTRAQFCKVAALASGFDEINLYGGYTIYPDVPANSWYAPYVNAAVRKYGIIKAYPDGTFKPNNAITYGEAVTIILRMLGYTSADIGLFWPTDDINKAVQIGLTNGMKTYSPKDTLSRGQAAILMCNLLLCDRKEGGMFAASGLSAGSADSIILSTTQTNPTLSANQAVIYGGGSKKTVQTANIISPVLHGLMGVPIFMPGSATRLKGFIADVSQCEMVTITASSATGLTTSEGKIDVPRDALTLAYGAVGSYNTMWFDFRSGTQAVIYYDESGAVSFIASRSSVTAFEGTYIYGVDDVVFATSAKFIKNGLSVTKADIKKYDALSYSASNNAYYVSDNRVTLLYQSGSPVYSAPSAIKAGNTDFFVSEAASRYFGDSDIKVGGRITLIFDYSGNLAAAMPTSKVTSAAVGVLSELSDSSCTIDLLGGIRLTGAPSLAGYQTISHDQEAISSIYKLEGQLVTVTQNVEGKFTFQTVPLNGSIGSLKVAEGTVGNAKLAGNVRVFECSRKGMALHEIALEDIIPQTVSSGKVLHTATDSSGNISMIVLEDVSSQRYVYGMVRLTVENVKVLPAETGEGGKPIWDATYRDQYTFTVRAGSQTYTYSTFIKPQMEVTGSYVPAAVASDLVGEGARKYNFDAPSFKLTKSDTVTRDKFVNLAGVNIDGTYVALSDDVVIYATESETFLSSLTEARANYTQFSLYLDRPAADGGTVRVITVK